MEGSHESLQYFTSEIAVSSGVFNSIQYINKRGSGFIVKNRVSRDKFVKYVRTVNEEVDEKDLKNKYKILSRKFHGSFTNRNEHKDHGTAPSIDKISLNKSEKKKVRLFGF